MSEEKKSERLLKTLDATVPEYVKSIGSFQYENSSYTLVGHYRSNTYLTCEICGHERIVDVYVIKDSNGRKLNVGNVCINNLTSQNIKEWFENYQRKRDNIVENAYLIDQVSEILTSKLPFRISQIGFRRLRAMLDRMVEGKQPDPRTVNLALYYANKLRRYRPTG